MCTPDAAKGAATPDDIALFPGEAKMEVPDEAKVALTGDVVVEVATPGDTPG